MIYHDGGGGGGDGDGDGDDVDDNKQKWLWYNMILIVALIKQKWYIMKKMIMLMYVDGLWLWFTLLI